MQKQSNIDAQPLGTVVTTTKEKAIRSFQKIAESTGFRLRPGTLALFKPNVCGMYPPAYELLESVIKTIKPFFETVIIGETPSAMHSPEECFSRLGIDRLAERYGLTARNLIRDQTVNVEIPKPHAMKTIPFPSTVLQANLLINCPGLGTHGNTLLTCALKNLFGLVAESHKYSVLHPKGVSEVLADICQVIKPQLNVVDCGSQVLFGTDALSVDIIASRMKGLDPTKVRHLALAAKDRSLEIDRIEVKQLYV